MTWFDRSTRLAIVLSAVLAGGVALWVPIATAGSLDISITGLVLFALGAVIARLAPGAATRVAGAGLFIAPAVFAWAVGARGLESNSLWLFFLLGVVVSVGGRARWSLPGPWGPVLATWFLLVAVSWPIVALREVDFTPALLRHPHLNNGRMMGPPADWVLTITWAAFAQLTGLLWFDWLCARYRSAARAKVQREVLLPVVVGVGVACAVAIYQGFVDITWANPPFWSGLRRATGTMLDANSMGIGAAMWGSTAAGWFWTRRRGPVSSAVALLVAALGLWATGSRTALLVLVAGTAALVYGASRRDVRSRRWVVAVVVACVALVAVTAWLRPHAIGPLERVIGAAPAATPRAAIEFVREMWNRGGYGRAASWAVEFFPWFGVGVGSFDPMAGDLYYSRGPAFLLARDNAQNWWRHQFAELGGIGGFLAALWTLLLAVHLARASASRDDAVAAAALRGTFAGFAIASLVGGPGQNPAVALSFWTLCLLTIVVVPFPASSRTARPRLITTAAWTLAIVFAAGHVYQARHRLRPAYRAMQLGLQYGYGFERGGVTADGELFWWTDSHAVMVFPAETQFFELRARAEHPDLAKRPVHVRVWLRGERVVDQIVSTTTPVVVRLAGQPRDRGHLFDVSVDRLFTGPDGRQRGLMITKRVEGPPATPTFHSRW